MNKLISLLFIISFLPGFAQLSSQEKAEKAVKEYLTKAYTSEKYTSYGFQELYKISPKEISKVDDLKDKIDELRKNNKLTDSSLKYYDSLVNQQVKVIKQKKLYSTYEIKHYFITKEGERNTLNFYNFKLLPDGKINGVEQLLNFKFVGNEYDWFYKYYRRIPMMINNPKENKKCYTYLDDLVKNDIEDRETTMATVVATHGVISRHSFMDTTILPRVIAQNWLIRNKEKVVIKNYSKTTPIQYEGEKIGYKLFVEYLFGGRRHAHYFEFDLNFILRGNLMVEKPYDQHFPKPEKEE